MQDETTTTSSGRRRIGMAAGLLAAGAVAGGVLAGTLSASAANGTTPSASGQYGYSTPQQGGDASGGRFGGDAHGSAPVRGDERALSAADAAKVKAAALKAVPGGTVYRVETDAGDGAYEAHMTKADGTEVTVKLNEDFAVTAVEDGMGQGDPAPSGEPDQPSGQPGGQADQPSGQPGGQTGSETGSTSPGVASAV